MTARKQPVRARSIARAGKRSAHAAQGAAQTSAQSGKRLSSDERRAQIIEAVEELFKTRSYAEIGVPDVAALVGITQGLVYHYFPTKEALLVAAVGLRAQELLRFCSPDPALPFALQVRSAFTGYLDYVEAHSLAYANLFKGPTAGEPEVLRICEETRAQLIGRLLAALGLAGRALPATLLSLRGYFGYAESVILKWLEQRTVPRASIEQMCLSVVLHALRVGLASDRDVPLSAQQLEQLEAAYRAHLELP